ncbi:hypothetical protein QBC39DRAFT_334566 [Podospora conica]|nr:hypothetical protein QBC39DRAFT_334566 [Schizothecium conicum]
MSMEINGDKIFVYVTVAIARIVYYLTENLYRFFKKRVYETNYKNVEKVLLIKVNVQEIIRLVLLNAFNRYTGKRLISFDAYYRERIDLNSPPTTKTTNSRLPRSLIKSRLTIVKSNALMYERYIIYSVFRIVMDSPRVSKGLPLAPGADTKRYCQIR